MIFFFQSQKSSFHPHNTVKHTSAISTDVQISFNDPNMKREQACLVLVLFSRNNERNSFHQSN